MRSGLEPAWTAEQQAKWALPENPGAGMREPIVYEDSPADYRQIGALQRIGGAQRTLMDDSHVSPELRAAWLAGWDEEDARLSDPATYVPRGAYRI